jgi:hypothetical protein
MHLVENLKTYLYIREFLGHPVYGLRLRVFSDSKGWINLTDSLAVRVVVRDKGGNFSLRSDFTARRATSEPDTSTEIPSETKETENK